LHLLLDGIDLLLLVGLLLLQLLDGRVENRIA